MAGGVMREGHNVWTFGLQSGGSGEIVGSTGAATLAYALLGAGRAQTVYVQTDGACTCSYQIRSGRTSTGPYAVLSSGTLSTGAVDVIQITGPLAYVSPRIKTMTSTSVQVFVELYAN